MIGIPLGIVYANATEWLIHKHLLHGLGRNKNSFWAFHWHDHHKQCRRHDMMDHGYEKPLLTSILDGDFTNPQLKEAASLLGAALLHLPLLPVAPFFTLTVWACTANYYRVHKKSHLDPEWANKHLPWHVDHHMGKNQDANWCVTCPLFDIILGTREKYVGTKEWKQDLERRAQRKKAAAATANATAATADASATTAAA